MPLPPPDDDPPEEYVRWQAIRLIDPGFRTHAEVQEEVAEIVGDDPEYADGPLTAADVTAIVDQVWAERLHAQEGWTGLSDADRLDSAFAELEASGIVARMNFTCCGSCGHAEIGGEVPEGRSPRGYVFFHMQDADGLAEASPAQLYFDYGAWRPDGSAYPDEESYIEAATAIGQEVARALDAAGLRVSWNGELGRRIAITDVDWRRRLPA